MSRVIVLGLLLIAGACSAMVGYLGPGGTTGPAPVAEQPATTTTEPTIQIDGPRTDGLEVAIFAGGCFWCVEADFDEVPGVVGTLSGYTGGHKEFPTYREVARKTTGHLEAVGIVFDPAKVTYAQLLERFWPSIDPTDARGQFCDRGEPYKTAIFYRNEEQERLARASREALERSGKLKRPIVTEILPAKTFWPAEAPHQNYWRKNPMRYTYYRFGCGRDERLEQLWGKPQA